MGPAPDSGRVRASIEQVGITSIDNWTLNATASVGAHTVSNLMITD